MSLFNVLNQIDAECRRQFEKWGEQNHPSLDPVLLSQGRTGQRMCEEYEIPTGKRAKALCENARRKGELTWAHIAVEELSEAIESNNVEVLRAELIQAAAVLVSWIDCIDRTGDGKP